MQIRAHHIKWGALLITAVSAIVGLYFLLAYIVLPTFWRHYEHQKDLAGLTMITRTANGIPGDPINVGLVGSREDVLCAMNAAGWYPADPITLRSSIEIVGSVLLDRPYLQAPVSHLYYDNRRQDLAFEKPVGKSADRRNHVRFWRVLERGQEGRVVWLGSATFDRGVGLSHDDGRVTHHIAPDIDAERDLLTADLKNARVVQTIYEVTGIGPTAQRPQRRRRPLLHRRRHRDFRSCQRLQADRGDRARARQPAARGDEEFGLGHDRKDHHLRCRCRRRDNSRAGNSSSHAKIPRR